MLTLALATAAFALEPAVTVDPNLVGFDEPVLFFELGEAAETPALTWSERLPEVDDEVFDGGLEGWSGDPDLTYGAQDFRPAPWSAETFAWDDGAEELGLTVSIPELRETAELPGPVLFVPLFGEARPTKRTEPLLVIEGVASAEASVRFHERSGEGRRVSLLAFGTDDGVPLSKLPIEGPILRLVDVEGQVTDLTLADLEGYYEGGIWYLDAYNESGVWWLEGYYEGGAWY